MNSSPSRVARQSLFILHPDMNYGGAERQIVNLTRCLIEIADIDITLGLYRATGKLLSELDQIPQVEVIDLGRYKSGLIPTIFSIRRLIVSREFSVVHSLLIGPNILLGLVSLFTPIRRLVWGNRVSFFRKTQFGLKGILATRMFRLLSHRADAIISNSERGHAELVKIGVQTRLNVVVPNGIDTDRFTPSTELRKRFREELEIDDSTVLVGQIGRVVDWKGHEVLLRAAAEILKSAREVRFVIVGDHDCSWGNSLKSLSSKLGVGSKIIWAAGRDDVECVLNGLDVLTMNSLSGEGFPNIVGEAMATATPVVGSDVGATSELLSDVGIIVSANDHQALADGSLKFIRSTELRKKFGQRARQRICDNFSVESVGRQTAEVLFMTEDALNSKSKSNNN